MIVAITGGIGSGKSAVAKYIVKRIDAEYCNTDQYCKKLMERDELGWQGVVALWGNRFLLSDGNIDRPLLRQTIFQNEKVRHQLENILHPLVKEHINQISHQFYRPDKILIVEIPLLFEVGWQSDFDMVVTVYARKEECIERVVERDKVSTAEVEFAINSQIPLEEKARRAHFVIDNSNSWELTCKSVEGFLSHLREKI